MPCLRDENLAALVDGSANAAQTDECDSCAGRLRRKQRASDQSKMSDPATDPDATITVKPPGKPNLDAGADQLPADAIPGYRILKELHRGGQGVVYQANSSRMRREQAVSASNRTGHPLLCHRAIAFFGYCLSHSSLEHGVSINGPMDFLSW
jgi:hypothetical protein